MSSRRIFGAVPGETGTSFLVWAQGCRNVVVDIETIGRFDLEDQGEGYFGALVAGVLPGARYKIRPDGKQPVPDIASRWQPDGHDGPSLVVSNRFDWTDAAWSGLGPADQVIYELHVGTFTAEGTWSSASAKLPFLKALGVTVIQVMPVSAFNGAFGWGYDSTLLYAPFAPYGTPDEMRAFVDAAHAAGIGVILDVVYNHVGLGDFYRAYSERYLTTRYENDWGAGFNFDGDGASAVRDFIVGNAVYWVKDFHIDGLRIDAAQAMHDSSEVHVLTELTQAVREAALPRSAYVIVENQPQQRQMIEPPEKGGFGVDAMYSDDFQHAMRVASTGHDDFYYRDYKGTPQELLSALKYGFLYQGQRSDMRDKAYGTYNLETPARHFIHFLENHDQVANSARGFRLSLLVSPARLRAITGLMLLGPQTPFLFQGQEFGSTRPFHYFFGIDGDHAAAVAKGRAETLAHFPGVTDPLMLDRLPDPADPATFERSKLDWSEATDRQGLVRLHRDLLALRRTDGSMWQTSERRVDGAVLGDGALLLRYLTPEPAGHRLILFNIGRDLPMAVMAEPLLAPPDGHVWVLDWSSEHPDYEGAGRRPVDPEHFWILPSDCTLFLRAEPRP